MWHLWPSTFSTQAVRSMAFSQQTGIQIMLDSSSVSTGSDQAARALARWGAAAHGGGEVSIKAIGRLRGDR